MTRPFATNHHCNTAVVQSTIPIQDFNIFLALKNKFKVTLHNIYLSHTQFNSMFVHFMKIVDKLAMIL